MRKIEIGSVVRYSEGWYEGESEKKLLFTVAERLPNPCTKKESRYLIICLNSSLFIQPSEVVEDYMIEAV